MWRLRPARLTTSATSKWKPRSRASRSSAQLAAGDARNEYARTTAQMKIGYPNLSTPPTEDRMIYRREPASPQLPDLWPGMERHSGAHSPAVLLCSLPGRSIAIRMDDVNSTGSPHEYHHCDRNIPVAISGGKRRRNRAILNGRKRTDGQRGSAAPMIEEEYITPEKLRELVGSEGAALNTFSLGLGENDNAGCANIGLTSQGRPYEEIPFRGRRSACFSYRVRDGADIRELHRSGRRLR